jgi:hypothetical protein
VCLKELVNLGGFAQRVSRDFELELAFANQCEQRRQCLRHLGEAAFEIEAAKSDVSSRSSPEWPQKEAHCAYLSERQR